jgi:peptide/nickel transport system ATP-binding protein
MMAKGVDGIGDTSLLEVRSLHKTFVSGRFRNRRVVRAVNDVSFEVRGGQSVGLVGESGSGKSTVARLIARLMKPTSGQILLRGGDVAATDRQQSFRQYRQQVQMVFQDPFSSLNPVHTVGYHVQRALRIHHVSRDRDIDAAVSSLLADVGLSSVPGIAGRFPHELSGGQRQRVAIARMLAVRPSVIIADEPTSMLDVSVRAGILNLLNDLRTGHGIGMLLITHDLTSARYATGHTLVMYSGFIVESGPTEELVARPRHPYTQLLVESVPKRSKVAGLPAAISEADRTQHLVLPPGCPFAPRCGSRMPVCDSVMPGVTPLDAGRWVRCHLFGPGAVPGAAPGTTSSEARLGFP